MKTSHDPRHKKRQFLVKFLFSQSFSPQRTTNPIIKDIVNHLLEIDTVIEKIAPEFPVEKINRIDLAILRLAVFELTTEQKQPPKVIIDEAVELAKEFGGDSSPAFINGALGNFLENRVSQTAD